MLAKSGLISFGTLALNGEDLSVLPADEAAYLAQESTYRLHTQLGLKADAFAFYPFQKNRKHIGNCPQKLACFCRYPSRQFSNGKGYISCIFSQKEPLENILEFVYPQITGYLKAVAKQACNISAAENSLLIQNKEIYIHKMPKIPLH